MNCKIVHNPPFSVVCHPIEATSASICCNSTVKQDLDDNHSPDEIASSQTIVMYVVWYASLELSTPLHELPQIYAQRLPKFDSTSKIIAMKHVNRVFDFMDLQEVDYEDKK